MSNFDLLFVAFGLFLFVFMRSPLLAFCCSIAYLAQGQAAASVQRLNDGRLILFGGSTRLSKQYGWCRGDQLTKYLSDLVARKTSEF